MFENNKIFIWSPFIAKVGTVNNVINSVFSLIKFSKKKNFKISIINAFGEWNYLKNKFNEKKVEIFNLNNLNFILNMKKTGFLKSRICYIIISIFSIFPLFFLLNKKKPNFLIIHLITSLPLILFILFNFKTKLILSIAGNPKMHFIRKYIWKKASKKIYFVTCPSVEFKNHLISLKIFDEKKIKVLRDAHLNINKILKLKNQKLDSKFFDNGKIIISIGRLTKQKNFEFLILAFKELSLKYRDIKLAIIGDGEEKKKIEKLIIQLKLENRIKLIESQENIYNYLSKSHYYISTSKWEGSSLAMIDAAYVGIPILCSNCPSGRKEFINNDERGYIFNSNDKIDFLRKFEKLINEEKSKLKIKIIKSKKETKKFTPFRHFQDLNKFLD